MTIGEKLRLLRKERGYTQSDVGDIIGQERSTIACYESSKRTPDVKTLEKLASLYKVTLDYFSEKSETDIMVELLSRSNAFFSANDISNESKTQIMNKIMGLYLQNATNEEQERKNEREDYSATTQANTTQDRTARF